MKKIVSVVGIAAAITLSLSATSANAASCPIKIGGLAPLSAPGAVGGGEAMRDAMIFAERDINAAGGVLGCKIKVVIADTEGLPEKAAGIMEKLITQDGVVAVGGNQRGGFPGEIDPSRAPVDIAPVVGEASVGGSPRGDLGVACRRPIRR